MRSAVVVSLLLLTGCVATPVTREFPVAPASLTAACDALIDVPATDKLSVVLATVTRNYAQYQECSIRVDSWNQWYNEQKKIFDSVK
jgi:hypothetical protein